MSKLFIFTADLTLHTLKVIILPYLTFVTQRTELNVICVVKTYDIDGFSVVKGPKFSLIVMAFTILVNIFAPSLYKIRKQSPLYARKES